MGIHLLELADELLVLILVLLPLRSITACKRSCRRLRAVIKQSGLLRCRIRTMKNFIEDLSPPGLSTSDFLDNVRKWERAWLTFSIRKGAATHTILRPLDGPCDFLLRSGYLIQVRKGATPGWSHLDLSLNRGLREKASAAEWTNVRLEDEANAGGWALDVDQDLVAVSVLSRERRKRRLEIRLMHFTTGIKHESAIIPVIQLEFEGKYDRSFGTHIEIMGGHMVVLFAHGSLLRRYQSLYLVDWTQGHVLYRQRCSADTFFPVLTSISRDTLVLGRKRGWALELCRITKEGDTSTISTLCKLKLPAVHPKTRTSLTSFSRTSSSISAPSTPERYSALPFRSSPAESVLSFSVSVRRSEKSFLESKTFFFYALPKSLRTLVEGVVAQHTEKGNKNEKAHHKLSWLRRRIRRTPSNAPIIVPWEDWGPKTTRWINSTGFSPRQAVCGMRCAVSEWSGRKVRVLDFNPGRLRRVVSVREAGRNGGRVVERLAVISPSTIPAGRCFLHDFQSNLPYYEVRRSGIKGDIVMDDEWIGQIQYNGISDPTDHSILVHSIVGGGS